MDRRIVKKAVSKAPVKVASSRGYDDDEDEEDFAPAKRPKPVSKPTSSDDGDDFDSTVTSGWGGADRIKASTNSWANVLTLKDGEEVIIRFLDDEPYANTKIHWLDRSKGRRSFICAGKNCPLCAVGDSPRLTFCFNVVKLTDGLPILYSLEVGVRVFYMIQDAAQDRRYAPLSSRFYSFRRSGKGVNTTYSLNVVKRISDISEDYPDLYIPSDEEIEALAEDKYTIEIVKQQRVPIKVMAEVAAEVGGDYETDDEDDE